MSDIAIRVENLSKQYRLGQHEAAYKTLRESIMNLFRKRDGSPETIWALKDVSFQVKRGEVLGIIGRNGAGKSTLLKILSRVTEPTEGHAYISGRVGSLLEIGTGFHPELTGRENIFLNGAILGMRKAEIERKFDEIVAFAEIEKFIDTPVKRYSSGMYVRLAFAVAAHLEPEILLVDEVLAVGDIAFQKKCLGKMGNLAKEGRTVLFVSHNMTAILNLCSEAMLLVAGRRHMLASPDVVIAHYLQSNTTGAEVRWVDEESMPGDDTIRLCAVRVVDGKGRAVDTVAIQSDFEVQMEYEIRKPARGLAIGFRLMTSDGTVVLTSGDTDSFRWEQPDRSPGSYLARCVIPGGLLSPRKYFFSFGAHVPKVHTHFFVEAPLAVTVVWTGPRGGIAEHKSQGIICPILPWHVSRIGGAIT